MPITVACPACGAVHTAADRAAGRTLNCRSCAGPVTIPAPPPPEEELVEFEPADDEPVEVAPEEEAVEVEPEKEPTASADAGPTKDAKPAAKKKKKKAPKPPPKKKLNPLLLWGGVGAAAFVLLVCGGLGLYFAFRSPAKPPDKEVAGVGWYKTEDHDGYVTAYFPGGKAKYERVSFNPANLAKLAGMKDTEGMGWRIETWERTEAKRKYTAFLFTLPTADVDPRLAEREMAKRNITPGPGVEVRVADDITMGKYAAKRYAVRKDGESKVSVTLGIGRNRIAGVTVEGPDDFDHTDPLVAAFVEQFAVN